MASIYLDLHTPSGRSRVYRFTRLRTDGVRRRESTDTRPIVLKEVPVTGAAFPGITMGQFCAPLFSDTPTIDTVDMRDTESIRTKLCK